MKSAKRGVSSIRPRALSTHEPSSSRFRLKVGGRGGGGGCGVLHRAVRGSFGGCGGRQRGGDCRGSLGLGVVRRALRFGGAFGSGGGSQVGSGAVRDGDVIVGGVCSHQVFGESEGVCCCGIRLWAGCVCRPLV